MSRRDLTRLAREPLTALSAMAGVALLALTLSASDDPAGAAMASYGTVEAAADLRLGPAPRLEIMDAPALEEMVREAAGCALAGARAAPAGQRSFVLPRGA